MFDWSNKRIEDHIYLCYIAYTLLNKTLLKHNKNVVKLTDTNLRKRLDKMKLSLIEDDSKEVFFGLIQNENEIKIVET